MSDLTVKLSIAQKIETTYGEAAAAVSAASDWGEVGQGKYCSIKPGERGVIGRLSIRKKPTATNPVIKCLRQMDVSVLKVPKLRKQLNSIF